MNHARGWIPPEPQHLARLRFAGPSAFHLFAGVQIADSADASNLVTIIDQLQLGSCTCNAIGQIIHAEMVRTGAPPTVEFLSRLWAYTLALAKDGKLGQDIGTHLCTVMDMLAQYGFPAESWWPYNVSEFGHKPPLMAYHEAMDQRAVASLAYHQITQSGTDRLLVVQQALTVGKLVAFGTPVTEEFCSTSPGPGTVIQRPNTNDIAGGHAMCWCGYERDPKTGRWRFRTVNSWGPDWGDKGFFWMDQDYLTWNETCDIWLVSSVPKFATIISQGAKS